MWARVLAQALLPHPLCDLGPVPASLWASTFSLQFPWLVPFILDLDMLGALRLGPGSSIYHTVSRWMIPDVLSPATTIPWGSRLMNLSYRHLKLSRSQMES